MSELVITPNFDKKTARFRGTVAAGEHATVRLVGASDVATDTLRLRVLSQKGTLAVFPLTAVDTWESDGDALVCTLNLNTIQAQKHFRRVFEREVLFVLDDVTNKKLHFSDLCVVRRWPQETGMDVPVDLDGYADFVADTNSRLAAVESAAVANADAISAETAARKSADAGHTAQISDVSDVVSRKADTSTIASLATKDALVAEMAARKSSDATHEAAIEDLETEIETVKSSIKNHVLDNTCHLRNEDVKNVIAKVLATKTYDLTTNDGLYDAVVSIIRELGGTANEE